MAARSKKLAPQQFNLWLWFKQSGLLIQILLGACAALITYAGAVEAVHKLGWQNKWFATVEYVDYKISNGLESTQRSVWDLQIDNLTAQYGDTRKDIVQQRAKLAITKNADERVRVEAQIDDLERLKKKQSDKINDLEKKLGR